MMKLEQSNDLKSAFVLVKCSKNKHDDCRTIRDAMLKKFDYIQEVYTTDAKIDNQNWCVAASALVPSNETEKFKKELDEELTANDGNTHITVSDFRVIVDGQ